MEMITSVLFFIHVAAGFTSLVLFWLPVFTRKGNGLHKSSGKWYVYLMWVVVITALALSIKNIIVGRVTMALFLGFLSVLTANPLWYGNAVLKFKKQLSNGYVMIHRMFNVILVVFGLFLVAYGWFYVDSGIKYLMIFFGVLGIAGISEVIRSYSMLAANPEWYKRHYTGMISSGIAAYTAFFAFGGRAYLAELLTGSWQLVPWIAPTVIGITATRFLDRYYKKKGIV